MAPFAHAKISGGAIINNNSNNGPIPFEFDDNDDAFHGADITGGIVIHRSSGPLIGIALLNQNRGNCNNQQHILSQSRALNAAIESLKDNSTTAAGQPDGSNTVIDKNENRASSDPSQQVATRATTSLDNPEAGRSKANSDQFDSFALEFAALFAKDTEQKSAIFSSLTWK